MEILVIGGVGIAGLTLALAQFAKKYIKTKWIPLVALVIGATLGVLASTSNIEVSWLDGLIGGIIAGLSAMGFYDVGKKTRV